MLFLLVADTTTAMNESEEPAGNSKNGGKQQREWRENFWAGTATLNTAAASSRARETLTCISLDRSDTNAVHYYLSYCYLKCRKSSCMQLCAFLIRTAALVAVAP